MGSFFTAALFTAGKSLTGWYLGPPHRAAATGRPALFPDFPIRAEITKAIVDMESASDTN